MIRKLKKGFTLVELVVVIAVIAILAAVSVVSYVGITKRAKESNDKMVIDQFNTVLRSSLTLNGRSSVHEILEYIDDNEGFDIRDFKPELKDTQFVYYDLKDSESFAYWDSVKEEVKYPDALKGMKKNSDLWFFEDATGSANKVTFSDGASHYLKSLSGASTIETNGGLDVGNQSVETINYNRSSATDNRKVTIRTNGGTLNINAANDTVYHYGEGQVLDIKAIASSSYHEFGHFPKAEIEQGRIVVEDKGQVEILNVTGSGVVVDEVGTGSIDLCYASSSEYVPTGTASVDVTVAEIEIDDIVARTENGAYTSLGTALSNLGTSKTLYIVADFSETFTAGSGTSMYTINQDLTMDGQGHTINADFVVNNKDTKIFMDITNAIVNIKNLNIVGVGIKYVFVADDDVELTFENVNVVADNCGISASNGHLVARNCSFRFVKGEYTRNDHQEAWAPVSSQYGGTVELFNCVLHSSDGYGLLVWPSGGTLEATKCSITNAKGFAVAWARNGAGTATRADSIVRVSNCVIEGSSACEAKYNTAQGGTEGYVYKDGVLVASTLSE